MNFLWNKKKCRNLHRKQLLCKFPKKQFMWKFLTKQIFVEISNKTNYWCNFSNKGFFLESFQQNKVVWICSNKATFCGNFPRKPVVVEILQPSEVLGKFTMKATSLWKFSIKAFFRGNFRKIHQTAKISMQQRCHAARVFVTLLGATC